MFNWLKRKAGHYLAAHMEIECAVAVEDKPLKHPPLNNYRCHINSAWYLKNNKDVIAVGEGFYLMEGEPVAHYIILDKYGNWFDPTIPSSYLDGKKFFITRLITATKEHNLSNASSNLMKNKRTLIKCLPWYLRWFMSTNTI